MPGGPARLRGGSVCDPIVIALLPYSSLKFVMPKTNDEGIGSSVASG